VLRVITRLNIGGPSIQAIRLSRSLAAEGFETLLLHGRVGESEGDMGYLMEGGGVRAQRIDALARPIAPWSDARAFAAIARAIADFRPHIVHTHMAKAGVLARTAALLDKRMHPSRRTRLVHTYHGHVLEGYFSAAATRVFIGLERMLARATDRLIAVSPLVRDELLHQYRIGSSDTFTVVPLGLDLDAFRGIDRSARAAARRGLDIPPGAAVVTTVGRLTAIKNHALFLDAAQRLDTDVVFLVAGDGELRGDLERSARERGLADRVRFLGWRRDLPAIYAASDIVAITSRNEGTPVALIEAMAAGVAVVGADVGGVRDVVLNGAIGVVVPPENADSLARAIGDLLGDPERRARMGAEARTSVVARYAFARLTADIAKLYRELL